MMTSFKFVVLDEAPNTATRPNGAAARSKVMHLLNDVDTVVIDLHDIVLTPSFADEFLGGLLGMLGESRFRSAVRLENVPESAKPLLRNVFHRRSISPSPSAPRAAMQA